jgi:hypothetical protein
MFDLWMNGTSSSKTTTLGPCAGGPPETFINRDVDEEPLIHLWIVAGLQEQQTNNRDNQQRDTSA